ncbi:aldehyde dehydrogenase [Bacillus salitolerans]|uniref:Aldehyde dehydrogenase n=1 Tax=Bacillus salitolerans TaxID=1437434 RepID=A0ABW4LY65_9BACI
MSIESIERNIQRLIQKQNEFFFTKQPKSVDYRIQLLYRLRAVLIENEQQIMNALQKDLNKSEFEAYATEVGILLKEISFITKRLKNWAKPQRSKTPVTHVGSSSYVIPEPYGVVLIIAPWNYPFLLAFSPLIGAIAAGNTAIVKPSELTPNVSSVIQSLVEQAFEEEQVAVVQGGIKESQVLLQQRVDYIFFTGSVAVGKVVMSEAAKKLIPVTLELGGKSPCIVHQDANLDLAAKRIAFGKFTNAGQTCIAPDYLLVQSSVKEAFIEKLTASIKELYEDVFHNPNYVKIVNERHFDRLVSYLDDGLIIFGGQSDKEKRIIEPTILDQVDMNSPVMTEEIFGPIFPIIEFQDINESICIIQQKEKPLALYLFSENEAVQKEVTTKLSFGGGCINDTLMHIATPYLPFGGVGESGIGSYHGEYSFSTFSHYKSVLKQTTKVDLPFRYPTFKHGLTLLKKLLK